MASAVMTDVATSGSTSLKGGGNDASSKRSGASIPATHSAAAAAVRNPSPYTHPPFSLPLNTIDCPRPVRVALIGGGIAGISTSILLRAKVPNLALNLFDKNVDLGGTWFENRYPGVRCDIPAHVYQATFASNRAWGEKFAGGDEICAYWQRVARDGGVYEGARLGARVVGVEWEGSRWVVRWADAEAGGAGKERGAVKGEQEKNGGRDADLETENDRKKGDGSKIHEERFDFVLLAFGRFNAWRLPQYPGMESYQGLLRHASDWDESFDPTGKRVAVIGNGASGIQVVPHLQSLVAQLDHYARSPTWISTSFAGDERSIHAQPFTAAEQARFADLAAYLQYRKGEEDKYWRRAASFQRNSSVNEQSRERFIEVMRSRVAKKPELLAHLVPNFSPNCRRLTPGPGYLEALCEDNVSYITTPIESFTPHGIRTTDGVERRVDAVICATGANRDLVPAFPIIANGVDLRDLWAPDGVYGFPYTYIGLMTPEFPNLGFLGGAHAFGASGTAPHCLETQATYFAQLLRKMSREGLQTVQPSHAAARDFVEYCDAFFATTVMSESCSSWYNGGRPGGRVSGLWPGSAVSLTLARRHPRWEDYEWGLVDGEKNRFRRMLGSGGSRAEEEEGSDLTAYLRGEDVDLRTLHEEWWKTS